jgi:hypothetical protein
MSLRFRISRRLLATLLVPWHHLRPGVTIACLIATIAVAGCAGQPDVALPAKGGQSAPASTLTDPQGTPRGQVLDAYAGYWQATSAAVSAGNAGQARQQLAPYLTPAAIGHLIPTLKQDWARHAVSTGSPVSHILGVKITGSHALVHDCVDLSQAGLAHASSGRPFPRSFGSAHANYYADLVLSRHHWLVSNLVPVVAPCDL